MTEPGGRTARWTAAALAAPVVAGVFAATTSWATRVDPLDSSGQASTPAPTPPAANDPAILALQQQLAREQAAVDRLSARVSAVRARASALAKANAAAGAGSIARSAGSSAGGSGHSSGSSRSSSSGHAAAPAPAPAPAPSTQGSTGASGSG